MKKLQELFLWFVSITVGILIICAVSFALSGEEALPPDILWQILLAGFVTAVVTTFLTPMECSGTVQIIVRELIHFIVLCAVMIFFGIRFGWIPQSLSGVVTMIVDVALVYAFTVVVIIVMGRVQANALNKALQEKYPDTEN